MSGTYFGVRAGSLYDGESSGQAFPLGIELRKFTIAPTTSLVSAIAIPFMEHRAYDWGGSTYANVMNNGSYLSVIGSVGGSATQWQINRFDYALNPLGTVSFTLSPTAGELPGYGFQIGNEVFLGDQYASGHISQRVNALTGVATVVDFDLSSPLPGPYYSNTFYDPLGDTLYVTNSNAGRFEQLTSASLAFGITAAVPEPSTYALMLAGLGFVGFVANRRRKAQPVVG
jgi:hypothetical protein